MTWRDLDYDAAYSVLASIHRAALADPEGARFEEILAAHPNRADAALRVVAGVLSPGAGEGSGVDPGIWEVISGLFMLFDEAHIRALFDDILFRSDDPSPYAFLITPLQLGFRKRMEAECLAAVRNGDERTRANARHVARLYFSRAGNTPSEAGARELLD